MVRVKQKGMGGKRSSSGSLKSPDGDDEGSFDGDDDDASSSHVVLDFWLLVVLMILLDLGLFLWLLLLGLVEVVVGGLEGIHPFFLSFVVWAMMLIAFAVTGTSLAHFLSCVPSLFGALCGICVSLLVDSLLFCVGGKKSTVKHKWIPKTTKRNTNLQDRPSNKKLLQKKSQSLEQTKTPFENEGRINLKGYPKVLKESPI